jgi:hypothetical protein
VNSCHADAQRAQISSPWKRSKNRVVKDEWVLQTGALSPSFGKEGRDVQAQVRAHTSQGFHDRPQSPFSQASGHGASHHPVDPLTVHRSLSTIQLSTSQFSRTSSADGHKQPPTLWVQDRYFMRPKSQVLLAPSLRHTPLKRAVPPGDALPARGTPAPSKTAGPFVVPLLPQ